MSKERRADGFSPIRLKAVFGADLVDTPALVSGMFAVGHNLGDEEMPESNQGGITQEQFDAGIKSALDSFGKTLAADILSQAAEKFSAKPAKSEEEQPTPDELRKAGAKQAAQIMAFAASSGLSDHEKLANEAIEAGTSVESFKATLADRLVAANKLTDDDGEKGEQDPHAEFRKEFRAGRAQFAAVGVVDEEAYVRSRCRDEGLPVPEIKKAS